MDGSTALHCAAFYSRIDMVKLLMVAGADRAIKNKYDKTCLGENLENEYLNTLLQTQSPLLDFLK